MWDRGSWRGNEAHCDDVHSGGQNQRDLLLKPLADDRHGIPDLQGLTGEADTTHSILCALLAGRINPYLMLLSCIP